MTALSKHSQYKDTPTVIDFNGVERFLMWVPPSYGSVSERLYVVTSSDLDRPDIIAFKMYKDYTLWWMILDYNRITDAFSLEVGDRLRIPSWEWPDVSHKLRKLTTDATSLLAAPVAYTPPPYQRPDTVEPDTLNISLEDRTLLNFGFPIPGCITGMAHFQLQFSVDGAFEDIIVSRLTVTSTARWFYYDPFTNNGAGGFLPYPTSGLDAATYDGQSVYFQVKESDGMSTNVQYYPRFKVILDDIESQWVAAPPVIIQP